VKEFTGHAGAGSIKLYFHEYFKLKATIKSKYDEAKNMCYIQLETKKANTDVSDILKYIHSNLDIPKIELTEEHVVLLDMNDNVA
jgi:hypothetical protein